MVQAGTDKDKDKATAEFIDHNVRMVSAIAKKFRGRGCEHEDMITDGMLGLHHAVQRYDPSLGHRFSTYATNWVRQAIGRGVESRGRDIRLPSHAIAKLSHIRVSRQEYIAKHGETPTPAELLAYVREVVHTYPRYLHKQIESLDVKSLTEILQHDVKLVSSIDESNAYGQSRYDFKHETRDPFSGISRIKLSAAQHQYIHHEFNKEYVRAATFKNNANEIRLELVHQPIIGWKGTFGTQLIAQDTNAKEVSGVYAILPQTKTNTNALFLIEENRWGSLQANLGLRFESAKLNPTNTTYTTADKNLLGNAASATLPSTSNKSFNLLSYSAGGLWNFTQGYASGLSYTVMQRAPSASELFAYGTHESTATFVIGNSNLNKETSHNLELNLQKTTGLINGKLNVYANRFTNFIYNYYLGSGSTGGDDNFAAVQSRQASATIKGIEGELTHNWGNVGSGARLFADASQGTFDAGGNLPLQPAPRIGLQVAHQKNGWLANASYTYSFQQNRLATWEVGPTPSYNLLNAGLSYTEKINSTRWTAFAQVKNILNESIRYATTPMAVRLYAPQPGRSLMVGVRANF
jgi:iron complex outermembrane receptor protein